MRLARRPRPHRPRPRPRLAEAGGSGGRGPTRLCAVPIAHAWRAVAPRSSRRKGSSAGNGGHPRTLGPDPVRRRRAQPRGPRDPAATCEELRALRGDVCLAVVSRDPGRAAAGFRGARSSRRGWRGLRRLGRALAASDLVLCGGGGLFQDDDSLVKMPYWAAQRGPGAPAARRGGGLRARRGAARRASSRLFARIAFACMERMSARDAMPSRSRRSSPAARSSCCPIRPCCCIRRRQRLRWRTSARTACRSTAAR